MSKVENAADGSWANLNSNQAVNLKNASPFKALKFSASPIILRLFLVNRHLGKKSVKCLHKFCVKKRFWKSGVQASPVALFPKTRNFYSTLSLFTQVCKRVLATYCWEVTLPWTSLPSSGSNTLRHVSC